MTPARHRHFFRFLEKMLGRSDFFLVGGPQQMKVVLPDAEIIVSPRGPRPFAAQNRYFSLCFAGAGASEGQARTLRILDRATEHYARRFPWLIRAVRTGTIHLDNSPGLFRYLTASPNPHTSLFRAFEAVKNADENRTGLAAGLFDFDALQDILFRIANAIPPLGANAEDDAVPRRNPDKPLVFPDGLRTVFINMLPEASDLCAELSGWLAGCRGEPAVELRARDWRDVRRYMSSRTVVFCVAADEECLRFLLDNLGRFGRVVVWDAGINREPRAVPDALLRDERLSLYLTSSINYFGALYPRLAPERRIPYIPAVTRNILSRRLTARPEYDFFVCTNWEQDLTFLFRHEKFFSGKKLMVGVKRSQDPRLRRVQGEPRCLEMCRKVRRRFPGTVFVPTVPRDMHLYFMQMARNIVIMYPDSWEKTSFSLSTALLAGRGLVTSPHPAVAGIDPAAFLSFRARTRYSDRELERLLCSDAASRRAARNATRFARRRLEFSLVLESIVSKAL